MCVKVPGTFHKGGGSVCIKYSPTRTFDDCLVVEVDCGGELVLLKGRVCLGNKTRKRVTKQFPLEQSTKLTHLLFGLFDLVR